MMVFYYIFNLIPRHMTRPEITRITGKISIGGAGCPFVATRDNIHIEDSWKIRKTDMNDSISYLREVCRESGYSCQALERSDMSLIDEWVAHNALYKIHVLRSHTKDVDLNWPQRWDPLYRVARIFLGWIVS